MTKSSKKLLHPIMSRKDVGEELGITTRQVEYYENIALYKLIMFFIEEYDFDMEQLSFDLGLELEGFTELVLILKKRYDREINKT